MRRALNQSIMIIQTPDRRLSKPLINLHLNRLSLYTRVSWGSNLASRKRYLSKVNFDVSSEGPSSGVIIDILYTLDSASNYSAIQKLKPWVQSQVVPMKWEDSYVFYFLKRDLKH
jgi:hypothetical protein